MQEDACVPISKQTTGNQCNMSETISHQPTNNKSENWPPAFSNCAESTNGHEEELGSAKNETGENCVE